MQLIVEHFNGIDRAERAGGLSVFQASFPHIPVIQERIADPRNPLCSARCQKYKERVFCIADLREQDVLRFDMLGSVQIRTESGIPDPLDTARSVFP